MEKSKLVPVEVYENIEQSQNDFNIILNEVEKTGGMTKERYIKLMSMQYHLTKGVQKVFFQIASHTDFSECAEFRNFLIQFALEEEHHYKIAQQDLSSLGYEPSPIPLDVKQWWAYFNTVIEFQPLIRLGATCILENITQKSRDIIKKLLEQTDFLTQKNTRFITIHQHEKLPHGDQIISALSNANLNSQQLMQLAQGSYEGRILYIRMLRATLLDKNY